MKLMLLWRPSAQEDFVFAKLSCSPPGVPMLHSDLPTAYTTLTTTRFRGSWCWIEEGKRNRLLHSHTARPALKQTMVIRSGLKAHRRVLICCKSEGPVAKLIF